VPVCVCDGPAFDPWNEVCRGAFARCSKSSDSCTLVSGLVAASLQLNLVPKSIARTSIWLGGAAPEKSDETRSGTREWLGQRQRGQSVQARKAIHLSRDCKCKRNQIGAEK
jgi:hypothetical protein